MHDAPLFNLVIGSEVRRKAVLKNAPTLFCVSGLVTFNFTRLKTVKLDLRKLFSVFQIDKTGFKMQVARSYTTLANIPGWT